MKIKPEVVLSIDGPHGSLEAVFHPCYDENSKAILIMAHGFRGSMDGGGRAILLAEKAALFVNVLRFNFTENQILSAQVAELQAVVEFAKKKWAPSRIYLLGRSMGGTAALQCAADDSDIFGLVLWATPNDLQATFINALGNSSYQRLLAGETLHLSDERGDIDLSPAFVTDFANFNLIELLKGWRARPLLIIHGNMDATVDYRQAQLGFALAGRPKKLVMINGADHSFTNHGNKAAEEVIMWLREHL